jgi:cell wall assembly regulator SMI1
VGVAEVARVWTKWLDVLEAHGFAARAMTRPGASTEDLDQVIQVSGIALPDDMLALYRLSNGQRESWPSRKIDSGLTTDLFPMYRFLSTAQAAKEWQGWKDIFDQEGPSGMADHAEFVITPEPDKVSKEYWHPGWWPLARDGGGNLLAVDTAPQAAGRVGQIIVMGSDEDVRRVFAPGIVAYLDALSAATLEMQQRDDHVFWDIPALR